VIRKVNGAILLEFSARRSTEFFADGALARVSGRHAASFRHAAAIGLARRRASGLMEITFAFLFVDLFDNVGTLVGVSEQAGFAKNGKIPGVGRALLADAVGTVFGSLTGTSTVTSYIESAAGLPLARARDLAT